MEIGNYIHLNYQNYLRYGIEKNGGSAPNPSQIFQNHKARILNEASRKKLEGNSKKIIEQKLNFYYGTNGVNSEIPYDLFEKAITKFLNEKMNNVYVRPETLKAIASGVLPSEILMANFNNTNVKIEQQLHSAQREIAKSGKGTKKALQIRMELLSQIKDMIQSASTQKSQSLQELNNRISRLEKEYQSLINMSDSPLKKKGSFYQKEGKTTSFIKEINDLIFSLAPSNSNYVQGHFAEAIVALVDSVVQWNVANQCWELIDEISLDSLQRVLNKNHDTTSHKGLNKNLFNNKYVDFNKITEHKISKHFPGGEFTANATPDKVDVTITIPGVDEGSFQKINTSLKNVNMSNTIYDIHLLSGVSVLNLVQEYTEFVNHYLNVVSYHADMADKNSPLQEAHNAMKATILLKALMGGVYSKSEPGGQAGFNAKADIFVINDNSSSRGLFSVYFLDDIIEKVISNLDKTGNMRYLKTGDYDKMDGKRLGTYIPKNSIPHQTARDRITNMLAQLHNMKLNVSISKKVFQLLK